MRAKFLAVLLLFQPVDALAETKAAFFDGNKALEACDKGQFILGGYLAGVLDKTTLDTTYIETIQLDANMEDNRQLNMARTLARGAFCIPDGATLQQGVDVLCKWLRDMPEQRHRSAAGLVHDAFESAWPCR